MKCDLKRPQCENCISSGRNCEFATPPSSTALSRSSSPHVSEAIAAYSIPFKIPGSKTDRQLLHYFCCQAAFNLSSFANPILWTELILQRSQDEPVIRNGLVALSALHKDFVTGSSISLGQERPKNLESMNMVSRSYTQLSNYLARSDATPQVALICSVIFYSLESLLGDSRQAITHLNNGLTLLKRVLSEPNAFDDPILVHLTRLFERLDVQASSYDDERVPVLELVCSEETQGVKPAIPDSFRSLDHAEHMLTKLQNWTLHQLITHVQHKGKAAEEFPPGLLHERVVLREQFDIYQHSLDKLRSETGQLQLDNKTEKIPRDQGQLNSQRLILLEIQYHIFQHLIEENTPVLASDATDSSATLEQLTLYNEEHLSIVLSKMSTLLSSPGLATAQSSNAAYPLASPSQRTYTLSSYLVAILYFVCLKTTREDTRYAASHLFSHPLLKHSRDGLWDAQLAATVVEGIMKMRYQIIPATHNGDFGLESDNGCLAEDTFFMHSDSDTLANASFDPAARNSSSRQRIIVQGDNSSRAVRLEDIALGIVDVTGGVEEAARRVSMISL